MLIVAWIYRHVFNCCRRVKNVLFSPNKVHEDSVNVSSLPWMWIGTRGVDFTEEINASLFHGLTVNVNWLEAVTGIENVPWTYLDSKTLEEKEFPSDGFSIEKNDSDDPEAEESADE